jgi:translation elongation factor EF-Ts
MKNDDKKLNQDLEYMAQQLSLHIAAAKPVYLNKKEVP